MIEPERERGKEMRDRLIAHGGPKDVLPNLIRELEIYGGLKGSGSIKLALNFSQMMVMV
jgi:hypothetical protein